MSDDSVTLIGQKADGSSVVLGTVPIPPKMKMRDIVRNYIGEPSEDPDDDSEASVCMWALQDYHDWLLSQGWTAPAIVVTPVDEGQP